MSRLFVFGCSMTNYSYSTWADLISANFDEYYNYGRSGSSNVFMMNRLVEANEKFQFNKNDTVIIMTSGIGRFSYYKDKWITHGDLYPYLAVNKDKILEPFVKDMWDDNYAVYMSWTAINAMKNMLKNIPHLFLSGINNDEYLQSNNIITADSAEKAKSIMSIGVNTVPFDTWFKQSENIPAEVTSNTEIYKIHNKPDGHPSQRMHYEFVKTFLPQYNTDKTKKMFDYVNEIYDGTSQHIQGEIFNQLFKTKYDKGMHFPLFG